MWQIATKLKLAGAVVLVVLASSAGTAWYAHSKGLQSGKLQIQSQWDAEKLETAQLHLKELTQLNKTHQEALNNARQRETLLRRDAAGAHTAVLGLRQQLATADQRITAASNEAVAQYARTVNQLLIECTDRYRAVAEKADGHASDAVLLHEGWPSQGNTE